MHDAELTRLAKRNRVEQAMHDIGCLIGVSFGVVFCWAALLMLPLGPSHAASFFRITAAIAAFLLAPIAGKIAFGYLANLRGHAYRTELARRYGQLPWKVQLQLTQQSMLPGEAAVLIDVSPETARSSGQHGELRIKQDAGNVRIVTGDDFDFGHGVDPGSHFEVHSRELSAEGVARLRDAWKAAQSNKPRNLPLSDEILSEKTQVAVIPASGKIHAWAAANAESIIKKVGDSTWQEFLRQALEVIDSQTPLPKP